MIVMGNFAQPPPAGKRRRFGGQPPRPGKRRVAVSAMVLSTLITAGCTGGGSGHATTPSSTITMSAAARQYLTTALDLMEKHSVRHDKINWTTVRHTAMQESAGAKTPADTYPAIRLALLSLNDDHSRLIPAPSATGAPAAAPPAPAGHVLDARVGYINVPTTGTASPDGQDASITYAQTLQWVIGTVATQSVCGWVLDLRDNPGGSSWAMLAGLAPLPTTGTVGYFVGPDGQRSAWTITPAGAKDVDDGDEITVPHAYTVPRGSPIALLTGPDTASAAEAVVIAFHGQSGTRSFGANTRGVPSGNATFTLSDGAVLVLTEVQDADRSGHVYSLTQPIPPDQVTSSSDINRADHDPAADLHAAENWLLQQPGCVGR